MCFMKLGKGSSACRDERDVFEILFQNVVGETLQLENWDELNLTCLVLAGWRGFFFWRKRSLSHDA